MSSSQRLPEWPVFRQRAAELASAHLPRQHAMAIGLAGGAHTMGEVAIAQGC